MLTAIVPMPMIFICFDWLNFLNSSLVVKVSLEKFNFHDFLFFFFLLAEPTMYALWCKSSFLWRKILEQNWNFTCVWTVKCCETIHATRKFFKCKNDHHPSKAEKDNGTPSFGKNHLLGNEFWVCRVQKLSPYCSLIHKD